MWAMPCTLAVMRWLLQRYETSRLELVYQLTVISKPAFILFIY